MLRFIKRRKSKTCLVVLLIVTTVMFYKVKRNQSFVIEKGSYTLLSDNSKFLEIFPSRVFSNNKIKLILVWKSRWIDWSPGRSIGCAKDCQWTDDKNAVTRADALLFEGKQDPKSFPTYRADHQAWVLINQEPPQKYLTSFTDLNNVFNWTMFYRKDSDIVYPYFSLETIDIQDDNEPKLNVPGKSIIPMKTRGVFSTVSNCLAYNRRNRLIEELGNFIHIDHYGACGRNVCPRFTQSCDELLATYKFKLAIENSNCVDYVTEKPFDALQISAIPIVYGGGNYSNFLPPGSYINIHNFKNVRELADYIRKVDKNDTLYEQHFLWKKHYKVRKFERWKCNLCEALYDRNRPAQVYRNMKGWIEEKGRGGYCKERNIWMDMFNRLDNFLYSIGL